MPLERRRSPPGFGSLEWEPEFCQCLRLRAVIYPRGDPIHGITPEQVVDELGKQPSDPAIERVLHELIEKDFLETTIATDQQLLPLYFRLTKKALQETVGWPTGAPLDAYYRLIEAIDNRLAETSGPEERSKLERFRDGLAGVGRDVFVEIAGAVTARYAGG